MLVKRNTGGEYTWRGRRAPACWEGCCEGVHVGVSWGIVQGVFSAKGPGLGVASVQHTQSAASVGAPIGGLWGVSHFPVPRLESTLPVGRDLVLKRGLESPQEAVLAPSARGDAGPPWPSSPPALSFSQAGHEQRGGEQGPSPC